MTEMREEKVVASSAVHEVNPDAGGVVNRSMTPVEARGDG
jgi:hypothetical protein